MRKDRIDAAGAAGLIGIAALLSFNQILVVWVNEGLQPVFFAGLRSALAVGFVSLWLWSQGRLPRYTPGTGLPATIAGAVFASEFLCLFMALDLTMVGRAVLIFYSMPVWLAVMCHFGLPGERLTRVRVLGLVLAMAGTGIAIFDRSGATAGQASLTGDLLALGGAFGWAGTAYMARATRFREVGAEVQLLWMVAVSAPILLVASPAFGPWIRDLQPQHVGWLLFQSSVVVAGGFIGWLALLARYPAASVASFAFLTPVISLALGWLLLDEPVGPGLIVALALVAAGIVLINRRA
jgi:drug/metabolite transporter (DMT)-like permease